jgi:hypothetical protein
MVEVLDRSAILWLNLIIHKTDLLELELYTPESELYTRNCYYNKLSQTYLLQQTELQWNECQYADAVYCSNN